MSKLFILFLFAVPCLYAQDSLKSPFEIGGSFFYSYSNTVSSYFNEYPVHHKTHQLQCEPEFGWFILPSVELLVDMNYTLMYSISDEAQMLNSEQSLPYNVQSQTHRIGLFIGCSYNVHLNNGILLFLGPKIGYSTTRWIEVSNDPNMYPSWDTGWQPVEFSFPSFTCGTKFFFNPRWALVLQAQYIKTYHYQGISNDNNGTIDFGLGITKIF